MLNIITHEGDMLHLGQFSSLNAAVDRAPPGSIVIVDVYKDEEYIPSVWNESSHTFVVIWDMLPQLSSGMREWASRLNDIPEEAIITLSKDENPSVRYWIAIDGTAPEHVFWDLAGDSSDDVRKMVAANAMVPEAILRYLANSENEEIRAGVAGNEAAPLDLIRELAEDDSSEVVEAAKNNPKYVP